MISVIVPAHNEANVIGRCLRAMLDDRCISDLEIIVVCNGCSDETAAIARSFGQPVTVMEIPDSSKPAALNAGDRVATGFPRFYVDADVVLPMRAINEVAAVLREGRFLAASPRIEVDLSDRSWLIRAFYRVWLSTPYHLNDPVGAGVYVLSEVGRRRFDSFPDVLAEDEYVHLQFSDSERVSVKSTAFTISPPAKLWDLIRVRTRHRLSRLELEYRFPALAARSKCSAFGSIRQVLCRPELWSGVPIYAMVNLIARARARFQAVFGRDVHWARDDSARSACEPLRAGYPSCQGKPLGETG